MQQLKSLREQFGLTQQEFASITGCNRTQLAMCETKRRPTPATIKAVMALLAEDDQYAAEKQSAGQQHSITDQAAIVKTIRICSAKLAGFQIRIEYLERKMQLTEKLIRGTGALVDIKALPELSRLEATVLQRKAREKLLRYNKQWLKCRLNIVSLRAMIREAESLKKD